MFFNLSNCPAGWSELTAGQGRVLVGLPSGGTLGETIGDPLSNQENRPHNHSVDPSSANTSFVGDHSHPVNVNSAGAHDHGLTGGGSSTIILGTSTSNVEVDLPDLVGGTVFVARSNHSHSHGIFFHSHSTATTSNHSHSASTLGDGLHNHSIDIPGTASSDAVTSDVIPYLQLLVCQKD